MKPLWILAAIAGVLAGGLLLLAHFVFYAAFGDEYERFEAVEVGMTEGQVRELLGEPARVYEAETAPEEYYVDGWSYERRPITNKVFIYFSAEPIAYVWFDEENRVEEVFVGGS